MFQSLLLFTIEQNFYFVQLLVDVPIAFPFNIIYNNVSDNNFNFMIKRYQADKGIQL